MRDTMRDRIFVTRCRLARRVLLRLPLWGERPRPFAFAAVSCCACACGIDLERAAEAPTREVVVINDGTNAMSVFCWPGDTLNGALNGSISIAAGSVAVLLKVDNGVTQDRRAAVIS